MVKYSNIRPTFLGKAEPLHNFLLQHFCLILRNICFKEHLFLKNTFVYQLV